jgi:hypothetical protein
MKSTQLSQSGSLFPTSSRYVQQYASAEDKRIGSSRTTRLGKKILKKNKETTKKTHLNTRWRNAGRETDVMPAKPTKRAKGGVGEGDACERECGRGWSRQKGRGDPPCGWAMCEWEVWHCWTGSLTHTLTRTYTHLPLCHGHTLFIVTDTHQHIDRVLYTYMTSYLAQPYRLSTLIDKSTLFINSWLIRLSVDNVLLINTRSLSIVIDKPIPLSIGISRVCCIGMGDAKARALNHVHFAARVR